MTQWNSQQAEQWHRRMGWRIGCNFIPSTAINQLEMWQADTFDPATIDRELGWAESLGFNTVRVFLHDLLWDADADGFADRIRRYLNIADDHGIGTMFVLFDDCWNKNPRLGRQPAPTPGVHNSGWLQSPSEAVVVDPTGWDRLERYVREVVAAFGQDPRVIAWDIYNEPGNSGLGDKSLPLLEKTFDWARQSAPTQPLTSGLWADHKPIRDCQAARSDVITFHSYGDADSLRQTIADLRAFGRPIICTEYLSRPRGSRFQTHLPIFKAEDVGCLNWGLVSGKTQTIFPWGSPQNAPEPPVWFHDIFRPDGRPFDPDEATFIRSMTDGDAVKQG